MSYIRMILTSLLVIGGFLGLFLSMGCVYVSSGQTKVLKPVLSKLRQYEVLALDSRFSSSHSSDDEMILGLLDGQIISKLRQSELFEKVYSTRATVEKEYDVKLTITILGSNTVESRNLVLDFAGQAFLKADLVLVDSRTGGIIGEAQVEGKSSAGYAEAGTTSQAIDLLAKEAVTYIVQHY